MRRNDKHRGPPRPERSLHPLRSAARGRRPGGAPLEARPQGDEDAWLTDRAPGGAAFDPALLVRRPEWAAIAGQLERLGRDPLVTLPRLADYAARVLAWNRGVSNLISRADEMRLVPRHLAESLAPAAWIAESNPTRCLDFGSGAGFPAVPLAIAGVGTEWVLVESRRPKILFMRKTFQDLKLAALKPVHARLEDLADGHHDGDISQYDSAFDVFTSRATLTLEPTLRLAARVVRTGGSAFLWKGSRREAELAACDVSELGWAHAEERVLDGGDVAVIKFDRN